MAKKPTITPIDTSFNVVGSINQNFENIKEAFENTLSLDGSTPNAMLSDLDLNSNDLLNVGRVEATDLVLSGGSLLGFVEEAEQAANAAEAARDSAVLAKEGAEEARRAADDLTGHLMGGGAGQLLRKNSNADYDYGWQTISGTGDMTEAVYDPQGIREDAFSMDFMVDGTAKVAMTVAERTAVAGAVRHDTAQALTPTQQMQAWANLGAAMNRAQNGYLRLPNGIIVQWGLITTLDSDGGASIAFPIAFPTARFACVASYAGAWVAAPYSVTVYQNWDVNKNGTAFWCRDHNGGVVLTGNINWIAIGW